jgi:hypothetical protein
VVQGVENVLGQLGGGLVAELEFFVNGLCNERTRCSWTETYVVVFDIMDAFRGEAARRRTARRAIEGVTC